MKKNYRFQLLTLSSMALMLIFIFSDVTAQQISRKKTQENLQKDERRIENQRSKGIVKGKNRQAIGSRDVLFYQDFTGFTELPPGWTVLGEGQDNWGVLLENFAVGEVPEVYMNFSPGFDGNSKLVTPAINTSGQTEVLLQYNQYFANYSSAGNETLKVETSSDGTNWNEVWYYVADSDFGPEVNEISINNADVGSANFQIAFTFDGDSYEINWWNIDNVTVSEVSSADVGTINIGLPSAFSLGLTKIPQAVVKNFGAEDATFDVTMRIFEGISEIYSSTVTVTDLSNLEEEIVDFEAWTPADAGTYNVKVTTLLANDQNPDNDEATKDVEVVDGFYFIEEFDGIVFPPVDWTLAGDEVDNWYESETDFTGGTIPEASFIWDPLLDGTSRLISPEMNTTTVSSMLLVFKQYLHDYAGEYTLSVQSTSDGGISWNEVWSVEPSGNIEAETVTIPFNNIDVGSENFQIAFTFEGNSYNIYNWYIDDIILSEAPEYDVAAGDISGIPEFNPVGAELLPTAIVNNYSSEAVTFDVNLSISDGTSEVYTSTITVTDAPLIEDIVVTFDTWTTPTIGEYTATMVTFLENDGASSNDTSTLNCSVIEGIYRNLVVLEDFTGTWCSFCPGAQMGIRDLIAYGYPVAGVAWHSEDNYETEESIDRVDYYAVGGFPTVIADGIEQFVGGSPDSSAWAWYAPFVDDRMTFPTPIAIDFSNENFDGTTFTADVDIEAIATVESENLVLRAILTESHVPEVWQTQYELLEIERLTFAGSEGIAVDLVNSTMQTVSISFDLDASWVPEFCEVVVFIQDLDNNVIYNGNKTYVKEQTEFPSVTFNVHDQNGNGIEGAVVDFGNLSMETDAYGEAIFQEHEAGAYYYEVGAYLHESFTDGNIVVLLDDETIDIELIFTNLQEMQLAKLEVYPNPANTYLFIKGVDHAVVSVYDMLGKLHLSTETNNGNPIDISDLGIGSYLISITYNNTIKTGKFTVVR